MGWIEFFLFIIVIIIGWGLKNGWLEPESGIFWIFVGFTGSLFIYGALCHTKAEAADIAKIIVAYLSGVGLLFSYFYNKREERKIKVHSEAHWRDRLFNLAQKKDLTYRDILYFLTFFNNNAKQGEQEDECDYKLLQAIESIINSNGEPSESQGRIIDSVYNILYRGEEKKTSIYDLKLRSAQLIADKYKKDAKEDTVAHTISSSAQTIVDNINKFKTAKSEFDDAIKKVMSQFSDQFYEQNKNNVTKEVKKDIEHLRNIQDILVEKKDLTEDGLKQTPDCCYILKELSISDTKLSGEQRAAFQLCIEFLLKADWNKQMNKEAGIKKSKNKKSKI